ncbi:hypothetical protein ONE63_002200 [Megalurothrips usitatus]|uniref:Uncharacterized protein n=1 Tax=Megalurothrips usitatus TaxID=439358 RepID=A0AAV7XB72_9NEOP|nr:hypothetical protein ONE63_002200 [Megalurothrips usitatus]
MAMALDVKISFSWTNYCRLCLLDNGIMLPLFEEEGQNRQLGQKIEACLQLVTYDGDPLPRRICHKCLYKINQTYEFRTMALESYERLKSHLLPLKHVPEVRQYLEKANCLQKHIDFDAVNLAPCSTPTISVRDDVARSNQSLIRIKSERDLMEDQTISPWPSASVSTDEDTPFSSITYSSSPLTSPNIQAAESTTTSDYQSATWSVKHEPLKRKRYPAADIRTSEASEGHTSPVLKKMKGKRQLAGPASWKRKIQNTQWKCVFCSLTFVNKHILRLHLDKCLKCPTCQREFTSLAEKAAHEAEDHMLVVLVSEIKHMRKRCSRCPARFASSVMLSTHFKYEHISPAKIEAANINVNKILDSPVPSQDEEYAGDGSKNSDYESLTNGCSESEDDYPLSLLKASTDNGASQECLKCHKLFSCSVLLESHVCNNSSVSSVSCKICNESFPGAQVLQEHEKIIHGRYKCPICNERFDSHRACNAHRKCHVAKQTNAKKNLEKDGTILKTLLTTSKKNILSCHTCFEEFEEEDDFVLHLYKHATDQSDDETMPKKKSRKNVAKKSTSLPSGDKAENQTEQFSVKCERCHVVCRSKEYYKVHLATHMSKSKTNFPCSGCNQDFRNVEALNRHTCGGKQSEDTLSCCLDCGQALVQGEDHICDNKCPECDKVFKSARGQRLHFVSKHQKRILVEDGFCDDSRLFSLEQNDVKPEGEQRVNYEETEEKVQPDVGETSCISESKLNSFIDESPPKERLPPDGAPPDEIELCRFDSELNDKILPNMCDISATKGIVLPSVCDDSDGDEVQAEK